MSAKPHPPATPANPPRTRAQAAVDGLPKRLVLSPDEQRAAAASMALLYTDRENPHSIQDIADIIGRSYATVHRYLVQLAGVQLRPRGGVHPRRSRTPVKRSTPTSRPES